MRLRVQARRQAQGSNHEDYETVGYVISGSAKLDLEGQTLNLNLKIPGWCRPEQCTSTHHPALTAIEATAPPAEVHGRDEPA